MRRLITSLVLVVSMIGAIDMASAQGQTANKAPEQKTFSANPSTFGALRNSVSPLTGQVSFPFDVASLQGKGGLNASVSFTYSSTGVSQQSTLLSEFSSTGILGLGWSMDMPRIVVDNKQTGTRHDDQFYLVEGGSSHRLICIDSGDPKKYTASNFSYWTIQYDAAHEKWILIKEDGFQYIYGDKNSERGTVQWIVKWGNWIGNSTQLTNQEQAGYIWNLSEVINTYGEKLTFHYNNVDEDVAASSGLSGAKQHTKASYLTKIVDPIGQSIELAYATKSNTEYFEPHTEQSEPDAYQEKFETQYLTTVTAKGVGDIFLYAVDLTYDFITAVEGELDQKRLLTKIQKRFPGDTQPEVLFTYQTEDACHGCLLKVNNSLGAEVNYFYEKRNDFLVTDFNANVGLAGWGQPVAYAQDNYVIVTLRKLKTGGDKDLENPQYVRIFGAYWSGGWHYEQLWETTFTVNAADYDAASISMTDNHFIYRVLGSNNLHQIHIARKSETAVGDGQWVKSNYNSLKEGPNPNKSTYVIAGDNFVAFVDRYKSYVYNHVWKGYWASNDQLIPSTSSTRENFATGGINYVLVHNDDFANQDRISLFYLDETLKWHRSDVPSGSVLSTDSGSGAGNSVWHFAPSFAVGFIQFHDETIYQWDENYTNFTVDFDILDAWGTDETPVAINNNSMIGITEWGGQEFYAVRFDGNTWTRSAQFGYNPQNIHFGDDYTLWELDRKDNPGVQKLLEYNPNSRSWSAAVFNYDNRTGPLDEHDEILPIRAGIDHLLVGSAILKRRSQTGSWDYVAQLPVESTLSRKIHTPSIHLMAPNYIAYNFSTGTTNAGSYYVELRNRKVGSLHSHAGSRIANSLAVSLGSFAPVQTNSADIHKLGVGNLDLYAVSNIIWSDGTNTSNTAFTYIKPKLRQDGLVIYFNKVITSPGGSISSAPFGRTETFYYNGLPEVDLSLTPPQSTAGYEELLFGIPYATKMYNAAPGTLVSNTENKYNITLNTLYNSEEVQVGVGRHVRLTETSIITDQVQTRTVTNYISQNGLPNRVTVYNSKDSNNQFDIMETTYKYWYEAYDPELSSGKNMLLPVIEIKTLLNSTAIKSVAHKWKIVSSKPFQDQSYAWLRTGSASFTAWAEETTPSGDWLQLSKVNLRDNDDGTVFETEDNQHIKTSSIFNSTKTSLLAEAQGASFDQVAFTSFDDAAKGNWAYNDTYVNNADAIAGSKSYTSSVSKSSIPAGKYHVSYWEKGGTAAVNITGGSVTGTSAAESYNGWTLKIALVTLSSSGTVEVVAPGSGRIDEVRLKPAPALMTSYVYDEYGNVTVSTNSNLSQVRTEFDSQYRATLMRDSKRRILKKYNYHFRNQ